MPKFCREIGLLSRHDSCVLDENLVMDKVGSIRDRTSIAMVAVLAPSGCGVGSSCFKLPRSSSGSGSGVGGTNGNTSACKAMSSGQGASLKKCRPFTGANLWNTDISASQVDAKSTVELRWNVSNSSYLVVSPGLGAVLGTSASTAPTDATTYTLYATKQYGRTSSTVTVTVH
jgi:hypothetical protein